VTILLYLQYLSIYPITSTSPIGHLSPFIKLIKPNERVKKQVYFDLNLLQDEHNSFTSFSFEKSNISGTLDCGMVMSEINCFINSLSL